MLTTKALDEKDVSKQVMKISSNKSLLSFNTGEADIYVAVGDEYVSCDVFYGQILSAIDQYSGSWDDYFYIMDLFSEYKKECFNYTD